MIGFDPEQEVIELEIDSDRNVSSAASLSDTSDPDQANDMDELLDPGFPVYFNFAIPKYSHFLKVAK